MPAPFKWQQDILVGVIDDASQGASVAASALGFQFLYSGSSGGLANRSYSNDGGSTSSGGSAASSVGQTAIANLAGGGRVSAWTELGEDGDRDVFMSSSLTGDVVISIAADDQVDPAVAGNSAGGFLVAYSNQANGVGALTLRFYNPAGTVVEFIATANATPGVYTASPGAFHNVSVAAIGSGYSVVWGDGSPQEIRRMRFSADGAVLQGETLVSEAGVTSRHPNVIALAEGGELVTWLEIDGGTRVMGRVYGGQSSGPFVIMEGVSSAAGQNVVAGELIDGRLVVIARSADGDIVGQVLFGDGTADGDTFVVNGDTVGTNSRPTLAVLSDGRFVVGWEDDQVGDDNLMFAIFDPREEGVVMSGTSLFDRLYGTAWADTFALGDSNDEAHGAGGADLIAGETGDDQLFGEAGADVLKGATGDDNLNGGLGADRLEGGLGSDRASYVEASAGVSVNLATGSGSAGEAAGDVLISIERLSGSLFDDVLVGSAIANSIFGGEGDDLILGGDGGDDLNGWTGADVLEGGAGADVLNGDVGVDRAHYASSQTGVTVRLWNDTAFGGHAEGDVLVNIENLSGSAHSDTLEGDEQDNFLVGGDGADDLKGREGADILNGGSGADIMAGGEGNDIYSVDSTADVVVETAGQGFDEVRSTVTFNGAAASALGVEVITLTGVAAINALGNALTNTLRGNDANNGLNGGAGADLLIGGDGNDTYTLDNALDTVTEAAGEGADQVNSSIGYTLAANVENLTLLGSGAINGVGNGLVNIIVGNAGANIIAGKGGADNLTGKGGADTFDYNAVAESSYSAYDRITDLTDADRIDLSTIDANTGLAGNQAFVLVDAFSNQAGQVMLTYSVNNDFTILSADVNGDGVADMRIVLNGDHDDFTNFAF